MASNTAAKVTIAAKNEHLKPWGHSKGYIFRQELLAMAKVDPAAGFNVEVSDHCVVFRFSKRTQAAKRRGKIVPKPLSFYFDRMPAEKYTSAEIFPADEPRGKERM
jgi:hypothetical protein